MSWKTLAGASAIGALVIVGSPAAQADTSTPAPTATSKAGQARLHVRAVRLCARAGRVERRVNRLITRFSAGPGTRGSVQFLQARANRVRATDAALADILDGRVAIRQSRLHTLQLRREQLPKVKAWCAAHDLKSGG